MNDIAPSKSNIQLPLSVRIAQAGRSSSAAALLSAVSYGVFSGQEKSTEFAKAMVTIRFAYEDKFDHYIYLRDNDELITLDVWVRDLDPKDSFYIGGIIDYHW